MQANWREIATAFDHKKNFVLATIIKTCGATYQKAGAMMLINQQGDCVGLLSGGCLEADISLYAKQVLQDKQSQVIRYDLSADADLLWGLGLGCDGAIDILLQPLLASNQHLGFGVLLKYVKAQQTGYYLQNIPLNASLNTQQKPLKDKKQINKPFAKFVLSEQLDYQKIDVRKTDGKKIDSQKIKLTAESEHNTQLCIITPIKPPINLLICGAGPDVVPVAKFAEQMGWQVTLWDHRKAHLQQQHFNDYQQRCVRAKNTCISDYSMFDAAIVMTHNLVMDSEYLAKLIATPVTKLNYIGLLGPKARRDKLLKACEFELSQVQHRVYGPVGLNLGGRGAQAIALSMISEIQQHFYTQSSFKQYNEQSILCSLCCLKDVELTKANVKSRSVYSGVDCV
ncbi:MAG: XdhC family protein [Colwellia sp.]|nr:XdhC family protein [Colwellia sp.]